jgi:NAD(P)-dependent dehydrogenase (short-subunit alcohol dehydrogenase family)
MDVGIITGASRGFGRAAAGALVRDRWRLVIDGRDPETLERAAGELRSDTADSSDTEVIAVPGDVADADHRRALVAAAASLGGLDLLVNNASDLGPSPLPTLDRFPLDELVRVYEINTVAPLGLIQLALPLLVAAKGSIVNVTSDAAVEGYEGWGGYGSSKAALEQLSRVLAAEQPDLRVYWFDPGDMRTDMHQAAFPGEDISDRPEPETVVPALLRLVAERPPSGRYRAADLLAVTR